jgi:hypothetical protein
MSRCPKHGLIETSDDKCGYCANEALMPRALAPVLTGWLCPRCGGGVAPWLAQCPCNTVAGTSLRPLPSAPLPLQHTIACPRCGRLACVCTSVLPEGFITCTGLAPPRG